MKMEVLAIARTLNKYGLTKLADKLVVRKYGQQIGRTAKNGGRTFCGIVEPLRGGWTARYIDKIDCVKPEKVITAIDKDYNMVGQTTVRRLHKIYGDYTSYDYTQYERLLMPKSNDPAQTCRFDITGFYGKKISSEPGSPVASKHYISRKALEPEARYGYSKREGKYDIGDTIYDHFYYSYWPMDRKGNLAMSYCDIGYKFGGETFINKVNKLIDTWYEHHNVVRNTKNSL